ncbi:ssDNA-binding protein [Alteromonas phage vB_AmaS-R9Y3]|nr:ssDNA-binding protein [Alteromonas phage vB_AmaS-R9Y3]
MAQFDENHVRLDGGIVVWDGVTQPETQQQGANAGKPKWTLKVVFPPQCSDLPLYDQLAQKRLRESKFKGNLPAGGRMPIGQVQPGEFNDLFPGWLVISFKTTLRAPDVYDENGQLLDPMQYGNMIYNGQKVNVLAHCYDYDNAGNKGISAGLDGIQIIASANAQRLNIGGGGVDTASAFGGQGNQGGGYNGNQGNQGNQGGGYNGGQGNQGGGYNGNQGNQGGGYNGNQGNQGGGYNGNQGNQGGGYNGGQGGGYNGNQGNQGNQGNGYNGGQGNGYNGGQGNQGGGQGNQGGPQQDHNFLPNQ